MSQPVTIEDIYKLFQKSQEDMERMAIEFDRRMAETDRRMAAEFDRRMAETDRREQERQQSEEARRQETDRRMAAEFDRRMAETDRREQERQQSEETRRQDYDRGIAEIHRIEAENRIADEARRQDYDRRVAEIHRIEAENRIADEARRQAAEKRMAKLEKTVAETSRMVGNLTTRWGRFVEELVEPAVVELFQAQGIDVKEVHPRTKSKRQGFAMEIDILAVDDGDVVLVECKSHLSKEDVDEFLAKLPRFKDCFPAYKNYRAYGALAGIEINSGIDKYAMNRGLFVIRPSGETVTIVNEPDFQPCNW